MHQTTLTWYEQENERYQAYSARFPLALSFSSILDGSWMTQNPCASVLTDHTRSQNLPDQCFIAHLATAQHKLNK
jgi:hypothetical protein